MLRIADVRASTKHVAQVRDPASDSSLRHCGITRLVWSGEPALTRSRITARRMLRIYVKIGLHEQTELAVRTGARKR
jgi:hypothetical protein